MSGFRLSTRITLGAIALVVAGAMALMFIENARLRDVYLSEQRAKLEEKLHAEKLRINQAVNALRQDVLFLSNTPPVSGIVRAALNRGYDARDGHTREKWEARLRQLISAFSAAHPDYTSVRYIGVADGGRELVRIDNRAGKIEITPPAGLQAKGDRDYFKAALGLHAGEVYLSEFNLNQEQGVIERPYRPTLRAATPVLTPSGQIFGMVVINLDATRLLESAASDMSAGVQAYLTNMGGEYLLHPDKSRSFGFELGSKDKIATDFPLLETMFNPQASEHLLLQAAPTGRDSQYFAAERIHFDFGNPARFLLLAYHLPSAAAAQQVATIPARHIVVGFIAMLLVGGIALLVLRRTFAPLEQLAAAADQITADNYEVSLLQKGSGEIGSLSRALNKMLSKLLQREREICRINESLEERVKERTLELERARLETGALLRRNQALLQTSIDGIHIMDIQGNLLEANDAFCLMLGYTREEAAYLNVADWNAQFTGEELRAQFEDIVGNSASIETVHRRKDGTLTDVEISAAGMEVDGRIFVFASARDITERKQAQSLLQRHHLVIETALDGFWITSTEGVLEEANEAYASMSGYTVQELVGMHISQLEVNEREDDVRAHVAKIMVQGYDRFETRHRHKDGHEVDIEVSVTCLAESQKLFAFCRDITGRKQMEEALRVAAASFETQDAIMITDADGNITRVNQAFSAITGYSPEEVLGKNQGVMNQGQHDDAFCIELLRQSIDENLWTGEVWDKRKNGQIYPKWVTVTAVRNERQEIIRYVTIFSDITARKQVEKENLRESDERFRGTLEQAAVGIAHATLDGQFRQLNQKFCKITGYTRSELIQMGYRDITFPADMDKNDRYIQQLLAGKISTFSMEKRYMRKDGSLVWCNLTVSLLRDANGTPKYTIGVIEDITERRQSEALAEQFGSLLQGSFNEIYIFDAGSLYFLLTSEGAEKNLGYSTDELNHLTPLDIKPLFTRESFEQLVTPLRSGEQESLFFETVHRRKDGATYPVEVRLQFMGGEYPVFVAIVQDITGRKQAEEILQKSESQYRRLHESMMDAFVMVDMSGRLLDFNYAYREMLGYSAEELHHLTYVDLTPEKWHELEAQIVKEQIIPNGHSEVYEKEYIRKDGTVFPVELKTFLLRGKNNQPEAMWAIVRDITERQEADRELNQSRQLLRELVAQNEAFREEERKSLAREVHDELGQILTALRMNISLLRIEFGGRDNALAERVERITGLLDQSIRCTRDIVNNLRPVVLDMGIVPAIRWQCDEFTRHTGVPCAVYAPEEEIHLDEALAVAAFRIAQESLTNVARYAEASKVEIIIRQDADNFSVAVNDDGKGFDYLALPHRQSFGLLGMRERATALGGVVTIHSTPQQGTQVFFIVPNKQTIPDQQTDQQTTNDIKGDNS